MALLGFETTLSRLTFFSILLLSFCNAGEFFVVLARAQARARLRLVFLKRLAKRVKRSSSGKLELEMFETSLILSQIH